ncbi:hypothetical protein C8R43DRAFT_962540 [Mycena crocata]|nr:hypothetical protein C8R43DRAFT_962540 [Mycena crocata]
MGSRKTTSVLGRSPTASLLPKTTLGTTAELETKIPANETSPPTQTQSLLVLENVQLLEDFGEYFAELGCFLLEYKADELTGNDSFTADILNPYAAFLRVVWVFNFLTLEKRTGQLHGIDQLIAHRPGNLLVWCPGCPEPGFNSDPNCPQTPHHLRHLNQSQQTLDGNFQCNPFNTDPDDISLCGRRAYFPLDSEYKEYLARVPVSKEKLTCNYLKAVNKPDKKKFKNMAITGTVNCQCSHVFILSCVDLCYGKRFANTDKALAMDL